MKETKKCKHGTPLDIECGRCHTDTGLLLENEDENKK